MAGPFSPGISEPLKLPAAEALSARALLCKRAVESLEKNQRRLILQVSSYGPSHLGGLEAVAEMLQRHLTTTTSPMSWTFCGAAADGSIEHQQPLPFFDFLERRTGIPMPIPTIAGCRKLFRLVRRADCLLVHDALYVTSALATLAARIRRKPVVLLIHVWKIPYRSRLANIAQSLARAIVGRFCLRNAAAVVVYSETVRRQLPAQRNRPAPDFVPNGVHDAFQTAVPGAREFPRQVVFAGRFVEKKGLSFVRQIAAASPEINFLLCGSGPIDPRAWRLPNVRTTLADKAQLREIFSAADLLLLPSRGEGFPLVVQEAMRCGLPCAIFRETWSAWGRDPEFFHLLNEQTFREELIKIFAKRPSAEERIATRDYAIAHWDWAKAARSYEQIFVRITAPATKEAITFLRKSVTRRSNICVIMPTCDDAEVTGRTVSRLLALHPPGSFDVLLVDNASDDHRLVLERVRKEQGVDLNYLVLRENGGSSGGQHAGAAEALAAGYEFIVFTDNDAVLRTTSGITTLVAQLAEADLVFPANVERGGRPARLPFAATLHYLALRADTLRRIGNIERFFFLNLDDVEFVMRALSLGLNVREVRAVEVSHPLRKIGLVSNRTAYFMVRNYSYLIAHSPVALRFRLRAALFLLAYVAMKIIHAAQFRDLSVIRTLVLAFQDFRKRRLRLAVPQEKFRYTPAPTKTARAKRFAPLLNRIMLARRYRLIDQDGRSAEYTLAV